MMFNPQTDISDLSGKVVLVTGGTAGIGKATVLALAAHSPAHIYFTGRNKASAESILSDLKTSWPSVSVTFLECDLASLSSIRNAASQFSSDCLDIFIGNAGILTSSYDLTKDGYELHFGTNHVGHAALLKLLLPKILHTAEEAPAGSVRVLLITSQGYALHPKGGIVFDKLKTKCDDMGGPLGASMTNYSQSKIANILYAAELARRYPTIIFASIHPGVVSTEGFAGQVFWRRALFWVTQLGQLKTPLEGAYNQLWAATVEKDKIKSGTYYEPVGVVGKLDADAGSPELAGKLWEWTEKELESFDV